MYPFAHRFLKEEPADARAGVDGREDEERLKHDGEVVPIFEEITQPGGRLVAGADDVGEGIVKDGGHADGERDGAAGAAADMFADIRQGLADVAGGTMTPHIAD